VAERRPVSEGIVALTLRDASGRELPAWAPGAHVDLVLADDLVRQYSICSNPGDREAWRIAVLRERDGRGGSAFVHDELHAGSAVTVRGPSNHFALVDAERYLFIAGGVGITPILPMVKSIAATREWRLLYGGRTRRSMAFLDELEDDAARVAVRPQDEFGLLDLRSALSEPREDTAVYCCGPEPLLRAVEKSCAHWPSGRLHVERFAPRAPAAGEDDESFEVFLSRSGLTLTVEPGVSILDTCLEAGVDVLASCEEGVCGTCATRILEGRADHRDSVLSGEERADGSTLMVCVSRSRTPRLVLDL
jgi:ferredoxin-NADP reductase